MEIKLHLYSTASWNILIYLAYLLKFVNGPSSESAELESIR
jgi:hypothetical protein